MKRWACLRQVNRRHRQRSVLLPLRTRTGWGEFL